MGILAPGRAPEYARRMRSPLIGLTMYPRDAENKVSARVEYIEAVRRAGGIPLLVPPGEERVQEVLDVIDGLLLVGGGDIDPALYGGRPHESVYNVSPERDSMEIELARRVAKEGIPTLGICRGAQVLNVALGGTLHEHLPDVVGDSVAHRTPDRLPTRHPVRIEKGTRTAEVFGTHELEPSSWHHQAVRDVAPGLAVAARAPDGTVEAIEMRGHPWLIGVQFHCELRAAADPAEQRVFDALVQAAARRVNTKE